MWVKICGNTRLEDCVAAAELGADAVGFVFAAGKRTVNAAQVAEITSQLPSSLEKIGVFTSRDAAEILRAVDEAGLTGVQLHGEFDPALAAELRERLPADGRCRLIQVVHWHTDVAAAEQVQSFAAVLRRVDESGLVDAVLVDSRTSQASGGTGRTFDWSAAADVLARWNLRVIVAGGLNPGNVRDAVRVLRPWGVDVSSGVETAPGVKDAEKVRRFLEGARG